MLCSRFCGIGRGAFSTVSRSRWQRYVSSASTQSVASAGDIHVNDADVATDASSDFVGDAASALIQAHSLLSADGSLFGWGVTLAATAFAVRAATFPLLYYGQVQQSRAATVSGELAKVQAFVRSSSGSLLQKYVSFRRLRAVALGAAGTSSLKLFPWYTLVNVPVFVTTSLAIRRLAGDAPSGWATGGIPGWFPDLGVADPIGALPFLNTSLWLWNAHTRSATAREISRSQESDSDADRTDSGKVPSVSEANAKSVQRKPRGFIGAVLSGEAFTTAAQALAVFSFPFVMHVPSGMLVFWVTSGSVTAIQRLVLSTDRGRRAIGLATAAELAAAARSAGPPVLQATGRAVRAVREQLEYVQSQVLTRFAERQVDESLREDVNRALHRERKHGRIGIDLESVIREDADTGRKYLAVIRKGTDVS